MMGPKKFPAVVVQITRWDGKPDLHVEHPSDGSASYQFLYFGKVREVTPVIGHEARHTRLLGDTVDAAAFFVAYRKGLFHIYRLAGLHGHDGKSGM